MHEKPCLIPISSEQSVSKCSAIPARILLKSILDGYRPYRNPASYLNLYWAHIQSTYIYIESIFALQESSILLISILDRYRLDGSPAFYLYLYMTVIGQTGIQRST